MCLVSVVMPVYNAEKYLREAIDSVLSQEFSDFEFIIINDGSSDNSLQIIQSYKDEKIKIINQENRGLVKSLNAGIQEAEGKYIARMDSDDICLPQRLKKQIDFFKEHPNCVLLGSNARLVDIKGQYLYTSSCMLDWQDIKKLLPENPFYHPSTIFLKSTFLKAGQYQEAGIYEDKLLWNRMAMYGELYNMEEPLINYRITPTSITNTKRKNDTLKNAVDNALLKKEIGESEFSSIRNVRQKRRKRVNWGGYYIRIAKAYLEYNFNRKKAVKYLLLSILYSPFYLKAYFNLLLCLMPKNLIIRWKNSRGIVVNDK